MLVYGDRPTLASPRERWARLVRALTTLARLPAGPARHAALVAALVDAGMLAQGLLDAEHAARGGQDGLGPLTRWCSGLLGPLARAVDVSWRSAFREALALGPGLLTLPASVVLPETVTLRTPEGFALYGLYPETYLEAARALGREGRHAQVVGVRSIGTTLGAVVAAGAGSTAPLLTVRPVGPPFQRRLALSPELETALLSGPRDRAYAIADEGPGLSGSSFGALADHLEARGVPRDRLHFFPSHGGMHLPHGSEAHRARWATAHRHVARFATLFLHGSPRGRTLAAQVEDLTGPAGSACEDVSGGGWRHHVFAREEDWPAVHPWMERRKYLLRAGGDTWLLKFAGLGEAGERRRALAAALGEAGLIPPVAGLRHGFLVQQWLPRARPLPVARVDRRVLLSRVAALLTFRGRTLPAPGPGRGASPARLLEMARHNVALADAWGLGPEWAGALARWDGEVERLARAARPVVTDNRMHAWEWLVLPDGRLLKADALDHHDAHDLVGCQDLAWDVAGAQVELCLTLAERATLLEALARAGLRPPTPDQLSFATHCYLAFQLGHAALAAGAVAQTSPAEATRLRQDAARYATTLRHHLAHT